MPLDEPTRSPEREWLTRAGKNLLLARQSSIPDISLELLVFHAQQAAELAFKAVYHHHNLTFQWTRDLAVLIEDLEDVGVSVPDDVQEAVSLTRYAVHTRYPGMSPSVTKEEHEEAVRLAQSVLDWAESIIGRQPEP